MVEKSTYNIQPNIDYLNKIHIRSALFALFICFSYCQGGYKNSKPEQTTKECPIPHFDYKFGAIVRGDTSKKKLALVFTGDEFGDGAKHILSVLKQQRVPGSFFFTGNFYRNPDFEQLIYSLLSEGHYLGAHSDQHLLYCDWENRDSLLITHNEFIHDLENNYETMSKFGISKNSVPYFLPPYEWYNDSISNWTKSLDLQLINYTYGTLSHADYTIPGMTNYISSRFIYQNIINFEKKSTNGLNGFILLIHIGTAPKRTDKFYFYLKELITELKSKSYQFETITQLLNRE